MRLLLALSLIGLVVAGSSFAQSNNSGYVSRSQQPGAAEKSGAPSPGTGRTIKVSEADRSFAKEAAEGGLAEVELGRLASRKADVASVKAFGEMMVRDHGAANQRLTEAGRQLGIDVPADSGPEHQAARRKLEQASGPVFDRDYIKAMVEDHEKDVKAFEHQAGSNDNPLLKQFAASTLPTLRHHLQEAQRIEKELASRPVESGGKGS